NTTGPAWTQVDVAGIRPGGGPAGADAVASGTRHVFVPQTPELYTYDLDGNLTADGRWTYTWDGENRLIACETQVGILPPTGPLPLAQRRKLEFAYDAQGRRFSKKVSNWNGSAYVLASQNLFIYDRWNMVAELNALSSNAAVRTYVWGLDLSGSFQGAGGVGGLLIAGDPASSHFASYDGNGNIAAYLSAGTGVTSATYDYSTFGETLMADGPAREFFPFRFSTKYAESETGLLYYGLRYYQPTTGRWLSRDPIEEKGGVNLYGMVGNDPVGKVDYLGLTLWDAWRKWRGEKLNKVGAIDVTGSAVVGLMGAGSWSIQVAFFPDTCEVAVYGVGPAVIGTSQENPKPSQVKLAFRDMPIGFDVSLSANYSAAFYTGDAPADANSWSGYFYGGLVGAGPVSVGGFASPKDSSGGQWIGGSVGVGVSLPIAARSNPQYYGMWAGPYKLPKCVCYYLTAKMK
ncbi:MAG: RHS repeat-associated core domain-containing protein, partial [Opitutaceae bacterium]